MVLRILSSLILIFVYRTVTFCGLASQLFQLININTMMLLWLHLIVLLPHNSNAHKLDTVIVWAVPFSLAAT